ncbi:hypothetical protein [Burkholderia plantarii]|uniref:hypothetical protein n=1 Tax=Burkholderia plantarii TaxID=41899 RepID=UPI00069624B8|nr:hypothetical protein [Burkholderia plantarii]GLZ18661.1 hypothetical protein Bpla01_21910 [Burkholderia plantarii]
MGVDYFPADELDRNADFRPLKARAQVIKELSDRKDAWGIAFWFLSSSSFLGGRRPQDLLATSQERVIAVAKDEVQEIAPG